MMTKQLRKTSRNFQFEQAVADRLRTLQAFRATGQPAVDVRQLLAQLHERAALARVERAARRSADWLRFARQVRTNHRRELLRLHRQQTSQWTDGAWEPAQLATYQQVLAAELATWTQLVAAADSRGQQF